MVSPVQMFPLLLLLNTANGQGMFDLFNFGAANGFFGGGGGGGGGGAGYGPNTAYAPVTQPPDPAAMRDARFTLAEEQMAEVMGESAKDSPERQRIDRLIQSTGGKFSGDASPLNNLVMEYLATSPAPQQQENGNNANNGNNGNTVNNGNVRRGRKNRQNNRRNNRQNNRAVGGPGGVVGQGRGGAAAAVGAAATQPGYGNPNQFAPQPAPNGAFAQKAPSNQFGPAASTNQYAQATNVNQLPGASQQQSQFGPAPGVGQPQQYAPTQTNAQFGAGQPVIKKSANGWQMTNPGQVAPTLHTSKPKFPQPQNNVNIPTNGQQNTMNYNQAIPQQQNYVPQTNQQATFKTSIKPVVSQQNYVPPNNQQAAYRAPNKQVGPQQNYIPPAIKQATFKTSNKPIVSQQNFVSTAPRGQQSSRTSSQQVSQTQNYNGAAPKSGPQTALNSNQAATMQQTMTNSKTANNQGGPMAVNRLKRIEGRILYVSEQLKLAKKFNDVNRITELQGKLDGLNNVRTILSGGSNGQSRMLTVQGAKRASAQGGTQATFKRGSQNVNMGPSQTRSKPKPGQWRPSPQTLGNQAQVRQQKSRSLMLPAQNSLSYKPQQNAPNQPSYQTVPDTVTGQNVNNNNNNSPAQVLHSQRLRPASKPTQGPITGPSPQGSAAPPRGVGGIRKGGRQPQRKMGNGNRRRGPKGGRSLQVLTRAPATPAGPTGPPPQLGDIRWQGNIKYVYADADGFDTFQWVKASSLPKDQIRQLIQERKAARTQEQQQQQQAKSTVPPVPTTMLNVPTSVPPAPTSVPPAPTTVPPA